MKDYYVKCNCCNKKYIYESSPMIKDQLWKKISNEHLENNRWISEILCLDCMEKKLGRKITLNDLGNYINSHHNQEFIRKYYVKRIKPRTRRTSARKNVFRILL